MLRAGSAVLTHFVCNFFTSITKPQKKAGLILGAFPPLKMLFFPQPLGPARVLRKLGITLHSCFVKKYKTRAPQWENDFNTFSAYNSQYIMIFWILQQCWGMLVVLSGHPVFISDGYWLF